MSFPRYEQYRDSGVEWLGEVPNHWAVHRLKRVARLIYGDALRTDFRDAAGDVWVFGSNGPVGQHSSANTTAPAILVGRKGSHGALNWSEHAVFAIDTVYYIDRRSCWSELRWLYWALHTLPLGSLSQDTGVPGLAREAAHETSVALPPPMEQAAITVFLDRETAKIDALMEQQRRLIDLLKEKRQALISHAVTKGLDPSAPMRDSGVEWLGEVPAHWVVRPLKYAVQFVSGGTPSKERPEFWNGEIPWASAKDLKTDFLADTVDHITPQALDKSAARLIPGNTVLILVRGMTLAQRFPVCVATAPMAINQDLKALTPLSGLSSAYLAWMLRGAVSEILSRIDEAGHGTKVLRMEAWSSVPMPLPPVAEQVAIAAFLDHETAKVETLVEEQRQLTGLLQERRAALISAAVTGKIDVRGLVVRDTGEDAP